MSAYPIDSSDPTIDIVLGLPDTSTTWKILCQPNHWISTMRVKGLA